MSSINGGKRVLSRPEESSSRKEAITCNLVRYGEDGSVSTSRGQAIE